MLGTVTTSRLRFSRVDVDTSASGPLPSEPNVSVSSPSGHTPTSAPDATHVPTHARKAHPAVREIWAVACCAPTDGPYIEEWVRYHLGDGGLDGVYIIDNAPEGTPILKTLALDEALKGKLIVAHDPEKFVNHISHPRVLHRHFAELKAEGRL